MNADAEAFRSWNQSLLMLLPWFLPVQCAEAPLLSAVAMVGVGLDRFL